MLNYSNRMPGRRKPALWGGVSPSLIEGADTGMRKIVPPPPQDDILDDSQHESVVAAGSEEASPTRGIAGLFGGPKPENGYKSPELGDGPTETSFAGVEVLSPPDTQTPIIQMTDPIRQGRSAIHGFSPDNFRRYGGPVNSNEEYIVGEEGPERFVPKVPGYIVPNRQTQAATGGYKGSPLQQLPLESGQHEQVAAMANSEADPLAGLMGALQQTTQQSGEDPMAKYKTPGFNPDAEDEDILGAKGVRTGEDGVMDPMQGPEYEGGMGDGTAAPARTRRDPTGSRKTLEEIQAAESAPGRREKSFWKRLGSGVLDAAERWDAKGQPGGGLGGLGAILGGGVGSAASPKLEGENNKKRKLNQLWGKYGQEMEREGLESKRQNEIAKSMRDNNKALYESITADDVVTDEEAALAGQAGYPMLPYDKRPVSIETRNGKSYQGRKSGPQAGVFNENPTLPVELGDQYYETEIPGGAKLPLKPSQAASTAVGVAQAKAGREERVETRQQTELDEDAKSVEAWSLRQRNARADKAGAMKELNSLKRKRDKDAADGYDTSVADTKIAALEGKVTAADTLLKEEQPTGNAPKRPSLEEQKIRARGQALGKSKEEQDAAVEKARAAGRLK